MSSNGPKSITQLTPGFLRDIAARLKLILRLMGDSRVNPFLKLLPVGALIYTLWPIDIPGPFDDAAVLLLGSTLFVELCPPAVVQEHLAALRQPAGPDWQGQPGQPGAARPTGEVVDAEFRETTTPPKS
jgi:hypothetical protein